MDTNSPRGERKLFLVPRTPAPSPPSQKPRPRRPDLAGHALIALAAMFVAVVAFAGYACLYGNRERAKDFLLIFLPPLTALMGAASAGLRR